MLRPHAHFVEYTIPLDKYSSLHNCQKARTGPITSKAGKFNTFLTNPPLLAARLSSLRYRDEWMRVGRVQTPRASGRAPSSPLGERGRVRGHLRCWWKASENPISHSRLGDLLNTTRGPNSMPLNRLLNSMFPVGRGGGPQQQHRRCGCEVGYCNKSEALCTRSSICFTMGNARVMAFFSV